MLAWLWMSYFCKHDVSAWLWMLACVLKHTCSSILVQVFFKLHTLPAFSSGKCTEWGCRPIYWFKFSLNGCSLVVATEFQYSVISYEWLKMPCIGLNSVLSTLIWIWGFFCYLLNITSVWPFAVLLFTECLKLWMTCCCIEFGQLMWGKSLNPAPVLLAVPCSFNETSRK